MPEEAIDYYRRSMEYDVPGGKLNLLLTRTRRSSIFRQPPTWGVNSMVIPAAISALVIGILFHYVPVFHHVFQTSNIPAKHFFISLTFALALLVLDETHKHTVRK